MHEGMECAGGCRCPHHKMIPSLIVLIGLTFLLQAVDVLSARFVDIAWPILLILLGLQKLFGGACKCCEPDAKGKM